MLLLCILLQIVFSSAVVDITPETFDHYIGAPEALLLEFYAPWCGFCRQFEKSYEEIGKILKNDNIIAARVDVSENKALTSRFEISSIPTLFLLKGNQVWKYNGQYDVQSVATFSKTTHKDQESIPYWKSPFGPLGYVKGLLMNGGMKAGNIVKYVGETFGLGITASYIVVAVAFTFIILLITALGIIYSVNSAVRVKED